MQREPVADVPPVTAVLRTCKEAINSKIVDGAGELIVGSFDKGVRIAEGCGKSIAECCRCFSLRHILKDSQWSHRKRT